MTVIGGYVSRRFLWNFILMLLGMAAFSLTFELMEEADQVISRADGEALALLRYSALRLPDILSQMVPIAALLAALFTLSILMHHSEIVAIWSGGVSVAGVMRGLLPIGFVLVVLQFSLNDRAVPAAIAALHDWGVKTIERGGYTSGIGPTLWLRSGTDIVSVPTDAARERRLTGLQIFRRDEDGMLIEQINAASAERVDDIWILTDVTLQTIEPPIITQVPTLTWDGKIDFEYMEMLSSDLKELPIDQIWALIENEGYGQRPTNLFRTWLHYRIASSLSPLMMILLVVSLTQRFHRTGGFVRLMALTVAIGFGSFIFENTSLALGESGFLPPWAAAWIPTLALACLIGGLVARSEG